MKHILLFYFFCLIHISSYAQTEKGKRIVGGQFSFYGRKLSYQDSLRSSKTTGTSITIAPNFGYFIKDNFAIGITGKFGLSSQNYNNSQYPNIGKVISINYGLGGFARYYKKINDKFSFFIDANILYAYYAGNTKMDYHSNSFYAIVYPGLVYFPSPRLGIEASFGSFNYNYTISKARNVSYDNYSKGSSYGLFLYPSTLYWGMNYYF